MIEERKNTPENAPAGIRILAILFMVGGIMWIIDAIIYTFYIIRLIPSDVPLYQLGANTMCCWIGTIILTGLYFGIAGGLMKGFPGAWMWALIFAIIGLINIPIGTIISIIVLIYLFTPNVKEWFKKGAAEQQKMIEEIQKKQQPPGQPPQS